MATRGSALHTASSLRALEAAWEHVRPSPSHPAWRHSHPDQRQLLKFATNTEEELKKLGRQLRDGYVFNPLRIFPLEKGPDKFRIICIPTIRDRIVQRALLDCLTHKDRCGLINSIAYGFARGELNKSHVAAAKKALELRAEHEVALKTDISQFFDSIDRDLLAEIIRDRVPPTTLHDVLIKASRSEHSTDNTYRARLARENNIVRGKGVRQGMPLSPFFAALFLRDFDKWLTGAGIPAVRYADDLIFFAATESNAQALFSEIQSRLNELGLECPDLNKGTKSQIAPPREPIDFLGARILWNDGRYTLQLPTETIERIGSRFQILGTPEGALRENVNLFNLGTRLREWEHSYLAAYEHCENCGSLGQKMQAESVKTKRHLLESLGIKLDNLGSAEKAILNLT